MLSVGPELSSGANGTNQETGTMKTISPDRVQLTADEGRTLGINALMKAGYDEEQATVEQCAHTLRPGTPVSASRSRYWP